MLSGTIDDYFLLVEALLRTHQQKARQVFEIIARCTLAFLKRPALLQRIDVCPSVHRRFFPLATN